MKKTKRHRDELVGQLVELFRASLAFRDDQELEAIREAMTTASNVFMAQGQTFRSPDNRALLLLNQAATREDALEALEEIAEQIEEHWEEIEDSCAEIEVELQVDPGLISEKRGKLPN